MPLRVTGRGGSPRTPPAGAAVAESGKMTCPGTPKSQSSSLPRLHSPLDCCLFPRRTGSPCVIGKRDAAMSPGGSGGELSLSPTEQDTPGPTRPVDPARIRRNTACVRCRDAKVLLCSASTGPELDAPIGQVQRQHHPRPALFPVHQAGTRLCRRRKATSERRGGGPYPSRPSRPSRAIQAWLLLLCCCGVELLCTWLQGQPSWPWRLPQVPRLTALSHCQHHSRTRLTRPAMHSAQ